jgi:hypothetical protein
MMTRSPRKLVLVGVAACAVILTLIAWLILSFDKDSREPQFIGYYGDQPELDVVLLPESESSAELSQVLGIAEDFLDKWTGPKEEFWPKPFKIVEGDDFWWVHFRKKQRIVIVDGQKAIQHHRPGVMTIQVNKSDLSCDFASAL